MNKKNLPTQHEWSFTVAADEINANRPMTYKISPNAQQRKDLAKRFDIVSIEGMQATITLSREQGGLVVHASGMFEADITQNCVLTLEPLTSHISDHFEAFFADPDAAISFKKAKAKREGVQKPSFHEAPILDEKDDPEAVIDGQIDLGELTAQFVSLSINPYPQKDDACFDSKKIEGGDKLNPFSVLKKLKK